MSFSLETAIAQVNHIKHLSEELTTISSVALLRPVLLRERMTLDDLKNFGRALDKVAAERMQHKAPGTPAENRLEGFVAAAAYHVFRAAYCERVGESEEAQLNLYVVWQDCALALLVKRFGMDYNINNEHGKLALAEIAAITA